MTEEVTTSTTRKSAKTDRAPGATRAGKPDATTQTAQPAQEAQTTPAARSEQRVRKPRGGRRVEHSVAGATAGAAASRPPRKNRPAPVPATPATASEEAGETGALLPGAAGHPEAPEPATATAALEELPDPWATAWTELDLRCPTCRIIHYVPTCIFLNARESPHLVQRLIKGHFNLKRCPMCRKIEPVDYPFTYFDPDRKLAVQVRSEWEWHAGGGEEWYAARLEDFFEKWADHDVQIDVVFGAEKLVARFLQDVPAPPARR